ncbi:AAEL009444-PA [Aedes aegypti]|uniref:AAEL009444-PA n=1 Tax=Aedes aegypti TaxID=7159 RepID=Q16VT0_AEDAE|nr:AAEL009444-PA [Aedes aegypti]
MCDFRLLVQVQSPVRCPVGTYPVASCNLRRIKSSFVGTMSAELMSMMLTSSRRARFALLPPISDDRARSLARSSGSSGNGGGSICCKPLVPGCGWSCSSGSSNFLAASAILAARLATMAFISFELISGSFSSMFSEKKSSFSSSSLDSSSFPVVLAGISAFLG